jgi:hypothetical protein
MCEHVISTGDFDKIERTLSDVIARISSLEEFEAWLKSQAYVESVRLEDYLLKTNPPQREFIVEFKTDESTIIAKAIAISVLPNQKFKFRTLRDV